SSPIAAGTSSATFDDIWARYRNQKINFSASSDFDGSIDNVHMSNLALGETNFGYGYREITELPAAKVAIKGATELGTEEITNGDLSTNADGWLGGCIGTPLPSCGFRYNARDHSIEHVGQGFT